ncbi:hypothetical protein OIO90_003279 [Microbotryomycetes sp. JL221]|nr:hypothetical protein OIO90_003279 [Microbotryomycetes sp. JL221]
MQPSLALVPGPSQATSSVSVADTANSLGVHDTLRHGPRSLAAELTPKHPLQSRLEQWEETQENFQMTLQRNMFGLHAPVRLQMERAIVKQTPSVASFNGVLRPSNLHLDILTGRDESIDASDVYIDRVQSNETNTDFHSAMETKLNMR